MLRTSIEAFVSKYATDKRDEDGGTVYQLPIRHYADFL